jgi:hypothetical protein
MDWGRTEIELGKQPSKHRENLFDAGSLGDDE